MLVLLATTFIFNPEVFILCVRVCVYVCVCVCVCVYSIFKVTIHCIKF